MKIANAGVLFSMTLLFLNLTSISQANDLHNILGRVIPGAHGCVAIQNASGDLRQDLIQLERIVARYEHHGQTEIAARNAVRQVGALQFQLYRRCSADVALRGRDHVRNALDGVRQAFRASPVLSSKADAFGAFKNMVDSWEIMRDLITDFSQGGGGCSGVVENSLIDLSYSLNLLASTAARYEIRSQTEFTARNAERRIQMALRQPNVLCNPVLLTHLRDEIRNHLDAVRTAFRSSPTLSSKAEVFNAFKDMVESWEAFRDLVTDQQ